MPTPANIVIRIREDYPYQAGFQFVKFKSKKTGPAYTGPVQNFYYFTIY